MNRPLIALLVAGCTSLAIAQSGQSAPSGNSASTTQNQSGNANRPRRAQAQLTGFDLAPDKASANQIGGASRTVGNGRVVLSAPHKGRVYSLRPSFWWQGDESASYTFHIQDMTGQYSWSRSVTGLALTWPQDAPPLTPGGTYLWRITPDSSLLAPPPPAAMIVVLADSDRSQIDAALAQAQGSGADAGIARAKIYFDHRLWYDTVMEYDSLISQYPNETRLYGLRGAVYDQLPVTQTLADADYSRVK
ncbi:MAG TPA: DUF928 domain-containing protein [Acidobacteriaceae bacterium]|jgi:hypothetical protein|nr:DUF928 domain-containing protein [Acidobacteriaceae bacterium]